jgi:hypothetical protein
VPISVLMTARRVGILVLLAGGMARAAAAQPATPLTDVPLEQLLRVEVQHGRTAPIGLRWTPWPR